MMPPANAPVPPPVSPSASVSAPAPKAFTEDQVTAWKQRLTASKDPIKRIIDAGKKRTRKYEGKPLDAMPLHDTVVVPIDYSYVEQKKSQLFFQVPELQLEARRADSEPAAPIAAAVINEALGPYGVNAKAMMFEVLTDALCPTGYGVSVIGYDPTVDGEKPVVVGQRPVGVNQPGAVLGLSTTTQTEDIVESVPNIIAETYFWDRLPPGFLRAPAEFRGSDFDTAPWIGYRFSEDVKDEIAGRRRGTSRSDDEDFLLSPIPTDARAPKRWGTRVYYQAHRFDADAKHPELIRTFVLYDDENTEKDLKNCPYQRWDPSGTMIGMVGYPVHLLTLRYLPDSCFPPSDVQMSEQQVEELGKGRTQMVQRRDRAMPQVGYDATRVLPDSLAKIQKNENTGFVGFNGPIDDGMIKAIEKGTYGRENFEFDRVIKNDIDQIWALGANAGVLRNEGNETATKANQIQSAVDTRLEAERTRVLEFFVTGAMKLFALKQLFSTNEDYVRVVGPDGTARLTAWTNQSIPGQYAFKAKPDSLIRIDAAQDREQKLRFYNLTANDPYVNRAETSKMIATAFGLDPARLIKQPDPKGPEPATGSISFKVEDFIGPGAPIAAELAAQCGYTVSPQAMQAAGAFAEMWAQLQAEMAATAQAQKDAATGRPPSSADTEHGGAAQGLAPVDKHAADITGGLPGVGH